MDIILQEHYRLLGLQASRSQSGEGSSSTVLKGPLKFWNSKIKIFLWRVWLNSLPTFENLFQRKITASSRCPLCNAESESIVHSIRNCAVVKAIWFMSILLQQRDL